MTLPHPSADSSWTPTVPRDTSADPAAFLPGQRSKRPCTLRPSAHAWWRLLLQGLI